MSDYQLNLTIDSRLTQIRLTPAAGSADGEGSALAMATRCLNAQRNIYGTPPLPLQYTEFTEKQGATIIDADAATLAAGSTVKVDGDFDRSAMQETGVTEKSLDFLIEKDRQDWLTNPANYVDGEPDYTFAAYTPTPPAVLAARFYRNTLNPSPITDITDESNQDLIDAISAARVSRRVAERSFRESVNSCRLANIGTASGGTTAAVTAANYKTAISGTGATGSGSGELVGGGDL